MATPDTPSFDQGFWQEHWNDSERAAAKPVAANPYVERETSGLPRGTAIDAGCGAGAEAILLAQQGWRVTAADISSAALAKAKANAADEAEGIEWLEADLSTLSPDRQWDLVMTHYAHPSIPQLDFYKRIAGWVAPGGTLLIVAHGHAHSHGHHAPEDQPEDVQRTSDDIASLFSEPEWQVVSAYEESRSVGDDGPHLSDTVVRVTRAAGPIDR